MELEKPMISEEIIKKYSNDDIVYTRIQRAINNGEHYIIPIKSLTLFETPVSIRKLKEINPDFFVPQCYCNIEKQKDIFEYLKNQRLLNPEFDREHSKIYEENLCILCSEMEEMEEYKKRDNKFRNNPKYNKIKCNSLLKVHQCFFC